MTSFRTQSFTCAKCEFAFNKDILASFSSFGTSPEVARESLEMTLQMFGKPEACPECGHEELIQGEPLEDKPFW